MSSKVKIKLGAVQETLLIPLLGRAAETKKARGLIQDPKAVEIIDALDYDFRKWEKNPALVGASMRSLIFDQEVKAFLRAHPKGSVVEIGAGLNSRYERLDNGQAHWLELDLPDSMQLRRQFFEEDDRRSMISASALDTDWHEQVRKLPAPYFFVSEAVMIYLESEDASRAVSALAKAFPEGQLFLDTTDSKMVQGQNLKASKDLMPENAWFKWRCDDPKSLEALGMKLMKSTTFFDADPAIKERLPLKFRLVFRFFPWLLKRKAGGYKMSLFQFEAA